MADYFFTDSPQWLLNEFNKRIEQKEPKGKITTWERSTDGRYYTHKSPDWHRLAWFEPSHENPVSLPSTLSSRRIATSRRSFTATIHAATLSRHS